LKHQIPQVGKNKGNLVVVDIKNTMKNSIIAIRSLKIKSKDIGQNSNPSLDSNCNQKKLEVVMTWPSLEGVQV
jgi:hypothetical protein